MFMQDATRFAAATAAIAPRVTTAPILTGLVAATLVETATGWRAAGSLRRGDRLHTFDGGLREVIAVDRAWLMPDIATRLLMLPGGVLQNASDLALLPGQHLMIDTWDEAALPDAVTALVPAEALAGRQGSAWRAVSEPTEVVTPVFADEEVIYANGGLLLHCPGVASGPGHAPQAGFFPCLGLAQARAILRHQLPDAETALPSRAKPADPAPGHLRRVTAGLRAFIGQRRAA